MPQELADVSPDQEAQTKLDKIRKLFARKHTKVSSKVPNTLVESRTVRNPLVPQPEPDTNPLQPMISRPSRSKTDENIDEKVPVHETRTGGEDAPHTHLRERGSEPAPQPAGQVVDVAAEQDKAEAAEHRKHVRAGKKAAATRAANQKASTRKKK